MLAKFLGAIICLASAVFSLTIGAAITFWWGLTMYNWLLR